MTESEYARLQCEAFECQQTLSELGRHKVLGAAALHDGSVLSKHIFTELVGLQLLLMNALPPLLRGEHVPAEQVQQLTKRVQAIKGTKAAELLAKRAEDAPKSL